MGKFGILALCVGLGALSACARREALAPRPVPEQDGHSPAIVFPDDPAILVADAGVPEYARRDSALGPSADVRAPADLWPSAAPSADRVRYLHLVRSAETTVIFRQRLWWQHSAGLAR